MAGDEPGGGGPGRDADARQPGGGEGRPRVGALALAAFQLVLIAVAYGTVRPPVLAGRAAGLAHRASGDAIAVLLVVVATMCLALFGVEDDAAAHVAAACGLLVALAAKIAVLRVFPGAGRLLPLLGTAVFVLLALTWITSAGAFLAET